MTNFETLKTVSQIADEREEPPARIDYVVRKLRIKPTDRIGIIRLYDEARVNLIKQGLAEIQIRGASHGR